MSIDVEVFPLHRFLGGQRLEVAVDDTDGGRTASLVGKSLVLYASGLGLTCDEVAAGCFVIEGHVAGSTASPMLRRRLACWLLGLDAVKRVNLQRTAEGPAFSVVIERSRA